MPRQTPGQGRPQGGVRPSAGIAPGGWQIRMAQAARTAPSRHETGPHSYLGVAVRPLAPEMRAQLDIDPGFGLLVSGVAPDSPAHKAGLQEHDVLLRLNDQWLASPEQLNALVRREQQGSKIELHLLRQAKPETLEVELARRDPAASPGWGQAMQDMGGAAADEARRTAREARERAAEMRERSQQMRQDAEARADRMAEAVRQRMRRQMEQQRGGRGPRAERSEAAPERPQAAPERRAAPERPQQQEQQQRRGPQADQSRADERPETRQQRTREDRSDRQRGPQRQRGDRDAAPDAEAPGETGAQDEADAGAEGDQRRPRTMLRSQIRVGGDGINQRSSTLTDDTGTYVLSVRGDQRHFKAVDADGNERFSGLVGTEEQREAMDADLREKLDEMSAITEGIDIRVRVPGGEGAPESGQQDRSDQGEAEPEARVDA